MNTALRAKRDALENLWRQGLSGQALLDKHTSMIDMALSGYFKENQSDTADMALVALGGYGRSELFPYSDIDLMLLYEPGKEEKLNSVAESVFYPLWDAGLEVGHGVRTPDVCLEEAGNDFFLQVSLLDARLIVGSMPLFSSFMEKYRKTYVEGQRKSFLQDMIFHRRKRHERFANHSYLLEPHIKEGRGGFRDMQAMLWSAQVLFGLKKAEDLEAAGLLIPKELETFNKASNDLIKIRNRLHYLSSRKNDQLFFEHQEEMAQAFGYKDQKGKLGVEAFMRDVHSHLQTIAVTTDLFFEHASEVLGLDEGKTEPKELETGIVLRRERIHISGNLSLEKRPQLLMRAFVQVAKTGFPLHHRTKKLISSRVDLINDKMRQSKPMGKAFVEILQSKKGSMAALTDMLESGALSAYIPEFANLKSLAQHDIYHVFTVDRHLLQTVEEMNKLQKSEHNLFITVASPSILFLAALLHDIGKGSGKNHAEYGADLARSIGERIGMPAADINCLAFLVREHLFLADIAMRRDLEDEGLIIRCAEHVEDPDRLTMLYLLTIADARATGPSAWSDWKAALLQELFLKTINVLGSGGLALPDPRQEVTWMQEQITALQGETSRVPLEILPDDYLQGFTPDEVREHIDCHDQLKTRDVLLQAKRHGAHWTLLIMTRDKPGMLSKIFGVLALHNLEVMSAQIYTWKDGTVVDTLDVVSTLDNNFEDQDWQALRSDLSRAIHFKLGLAHRLHQKLKPAQHASPQVGKQQPAKVIIDHSESELYTIIEVYALNRTGLLYDITRTLTDFGINIFRAKIGTKGDQIVDVFYVLNHEGEKIKDIAFQQEIQNSLLYIAG